VLFVAPTDEDWLDPIRWAKEALERTIGVLDEGEGYNRPRQVQTDAHDAAMSFYDEHIEYLEAFLKEYGLEKYRDGGPADGGEDEGNGTPTG